MYTDAIRAGLWVVNIKLWCKLQRRARLAGRDALRWVYDFFNSLSHRLFRTFRFCSKIHKLLLHKLLLQILEDARWKKGAKEKRANDPRLGNDPTPDPDDLFITFPLMRLTFWLHEPTSKAVFKVLGPLLLVVTLMWVRKLSFCQFWL